MNGVTVAVTVLLALAVLVDVLAVTGLAVMRTPMQRLHFVGPASIVAPALAGIAVVIGTHATASQAPKAIVVALALALFGGVISHETGRAIVSREQAGDA